MDLLALIRTFAEKPSRVRESADGESLIFEGVREQSSDIGGGEVVRTVRFLKTTPTRLRSANKSDETPYDLASLWFFIKCVLCAGGAQRQSRTASSSPSISHTTPLLLVLLLLPSPLLPPSPLLFLLPTPHLHPAHRTPASPPSSPLCAATRRQSRIS